LKIGSVLDCINLDKMLAFWKEALHYAPREPVGKDLAIFRDPSGRNFCTIDFRRVERFLRSVHSNPP
jgi:hypothetical protein